MKLEHLKRVASSRFRTICKQDEELASCKKLLEARNLEWARLHAENDRLKREHDRRVTELLEANNRLLERARAAEGMKRKLREGLQELAQLQGYSKGFSNGVESNGIEEAEYWHAQTMEKVKELFKESA
jgi:hypothetical protein